MKVKTLLLTVAGIAAVCACWFSYANAHPAKHKGTKIQTVNSWANFKVPAGVTNWSAATR